MALTYGRSTRSSRSRSRRSRSRSRSCSHSRSRSRSQSSRKHHYSAPTTRYRTRKHRSRSPRRSPRNLSHHSSHSSQSISRTSRDRSAPCDRRRQSKEERAKQVAHQILVNQLMDPRKAPESDLYSKYNTQAGFILRGLHLFINIKNLFDHGLRSEGFDMTTAGVVVDDDDSEDEEEPRANSPAPSDHGSQDTQDDSCNPEVDVDGTAEPDDAPENDSFDVDAMYANLYRRLKEMIPELDDTMDRFKQDTRGLQLFIKMIIRTAKAARGTDTKNFKDAIGDYIPCDPTIDVLQPPISASPLKSDRGFNHRMIAPLLVPWHQYAVYKENPSEFITKVLNKEIVIMHESCPMFMYDDALYDPKDSEAGFGQGYLFLRGCKHYIGGKNFVFRDPESSKSLSGCTLFHKYRIKTLTPQLIATIACQIRFALCTKQYWHSVDGAFNLRMFYQKVITYLDDPEDEWVQETMKFLHKQVLPKQDEAEDNPDVDDKEPDSEMKNLQSARQARRDARKKAAEEEAKKLAEEERQKKAAEEQAQQTAAAGGEDETGKDGDGGRGEDDPAQSNDESS